MLFGGVVTQRREVPEQILKGGHHHLEERKDEILDYTPRSFHVCDCAGFL